MIIFLLFLCHIWGMSIIYEVAYGPILDKTYYSHFLSQVMRSHHPHCKTLGWRTSVFLVLIIYILLFHFFPLQAKGNIKTVGSASFSLPLTLMNSSNSTYHSQTACLGKNVKIFKYLLARFRGALSGLEAICCFLYNGGGGISHLLSLALGF